jgi:hypothetical protein
MLRSFFALSVAISLSACGAESDDKDDKASASGGGFDGTWLQGCEHEEEVTGSQTTKSTSEISCG